MRAGVHDEDSRARGCDHVSLSKWHRHRRSRDARKSSTATRKRNRRVGGDASDRGAPYVFTTCGSETISAEPGSIISREIATRGSGDGDRGVRGGAHECAEHGKKTPGLPQSRATEARTAS